MNDLERRLLVATTSGHQWLRDDRFHKAEVAFAEALRCFDALAADHTENRCLERAELVAAWAAALQELDRWGEAEPSLTEALASLENQALAKTTASGVVAAMLHLALGRTCLARRQAVQALPHLEAALGLLRDSGAEMLTFSAQLHLAIALSAGGNAEAAMALLNTAAATLDQPQYRSQLRERTILLINTGYVQLMRGQLNEACSALEQAVAMLDGVIGAGRTARHGDKANALMNLGCALDRSGRPEEAVPHLRAALRCFEPALRRARRFGTGARLPALRGLTLMNLGCCLFELSDFGAAESAFRRALRSYSGVQQAHPHVRDYLARTWVNQAHLAARSGQLQRAARLYSQGLEVLDAALEQRPYLKPDRANIVLGLARLRLLQGRADEGMALFESAMTTLRDLTLAGHTQQAWVWLDGWNQQLSALLQAECAMHGGKPPQRRSGTSEGHWEVLRRVILQPPRRGLGDGSVPLHALQTALGAVEEWSALAVSAQPLTVLLSGLLEPYLRYLFECLADLLTDVEAGWLAQHSQELVRTLARLRNAAEAQPHAAQLLVDWFLHTRGLRAQRSALAIGDDPQLVALRELLQALRQLEDEMLGATRSDIGSSGSDSRFPGLLSLSSSRPAVDQVQERAVGWQKLRDQVEVLRQQLVEDGLLPAVLRLNTAEVAARMAPNSALLMLARHDGPKVLVIMLHRPMTAGAIAHHLVAEQHPDLEHFSLAELNRLARQAVGQNARGQALRGAAAATAATAATADTAKCSGTISLAELDRFALDVFSSVWHRTVMPMLETLMGSGCNDVCLVPSDDLQLVPWTHFAATAAPPACRVEIYPSCGAWVRCRLQPEPEATAAPRWALAAWAALDSDRPLPWVEVERYLSARLWNDVSGSVELLQGSRPQADGVAALLGMGHGGSPDDNPANAGLTMAGDQILGAHALPGIRTCRRVVLSACALGRIDDAFGEPLGFLSSCFDYGAGFGTGWLTEVPDAAACWASLAMQFALRRAYALGSVTPVRWGQVFGQTRLEILSGSWPEGLVEWLAIEVPAALDSLSGQTALLPAITFEVELLRGPPEVLMRALPWAVAFGR